MANHLSREKRIAVVRALVEGCSIRATSRMTGVHKTTILGHLVRLGEACTVALDHLITGVPCTVVEVDEIWSYIGKKQRMVTPADPAEKGDCYTFVSLCADTKLVINHLVGKRTAECATAFMLDLARRLAGRIQLSSDGFKPYINAVEWAFGADVDYAMIIKEYGTDEEALRGKYSPPTVQSVKKLGIKGFPDDDRISTSYIERQNLTMRMMMRRFTRLTNAFSKKLENHKAAVALHFAYYNFCRPHMSLDGIAPAMAAGVTDRMWEVEDLVDLAA